MNQYNPNVPPDAEDWLSLDEDERIELVMNYHEEMTISLPSIQAHAVIHIIVENQIAQRSKGVVETLARLMRQGLDRHDALHAIGAVIAEDTFRLLKGEDETWDHKRYRRRLEKLTAKRWRSGRY